MTCEERIYKIIHNVQFVNMQELCMVLFVIYSL